MAIRKKRKAPLYAGLSKIKWRPQKKMTQAELKTRIAIFNEKAVAAVFSTGATDAKENRKRKPDP